MFWKNAKGEGKCYFVQVLLRKAFFEMYSELEEKKEN